MSRSRTRPSDVIFDLLRSTRRRRQPAGALIETGALFGFSENTMRVTLSRLMARGRIESPSRGVYSLSPQTDALNDFVERWRLGEQRVRPWQPGRWLFAHAAEPPDAALWALDALGFRAAQPGLFVRPDNLAMEGDALRALASSIGLVPEVLLIAGTPQGEAVPEGWVALWKPAALDADYRRCIERLEASAARLPELDDDDARLECFRLGGEMIHRLAKDPLLPAELVDATARDALGQATLEYDRLGKELWASASHGELRHMPHPRLAATS